MTVFRDAQNLYLNRGFNDIFMIYDFF